MASAWEILGVLAVLAFVFVVWPVWVYRDSRRQGSDHPLFWAVAAFVGSLVTWFWFAVFYLVYRSRIGTDEHSRPPGAGERAQSIGIARLLLALGVGSIIIYITYRVTEPILSHASDSAPQDSVYSQGNEWMIQATDPQTLGIAVLVVSVFGLIAYSVFQRTRLQ